MCSFRVIVWEDARSKVVPKEVAVMREMTVVLSWWQGYGRPGAVDGGILFNKDRKSTRLNSSHEFVSRMPSSA